MRKQFILFGLAMLCASIVFLGCSNSTTPTTNNANGGTNQSSTNKSDDQNADHDGHDHADHDQATKSGKSEMEKMKEGLAGLSVEDRASAMKQHFCPVSGGMLGVMGEPRKIKVKDQDVWICCDGCEADLLADPDKYLAKLKK